MSQDDSAKRSEQAPLSRLQSRAIVIEEQGVSAGRVSSGIRRMTSERGKSGVFRYASRGTSGSNGKLLQAASSVAPCSPWQENMQGKWLTRSGTHL